MSIPEGYSFYDHRKSHPEDLLNTYGEEVLVAQYRYAQGVLERLGEMMNTERYQRFAEQYPERVQQWTAQESELERWLDNAQDYLPKGVEP